MGFELKSYGDSQMAIINNNGILDGNRIEAEDISGSHDPQTPNQTKDIFLSNFKRIAKNQREYLSAKELLKKIRYYKNNKPK